MKAHHVRHLAVAVACVMALGACSASSSDSAESAADPALDRAGGGFSEEQARVPAIGDSQAVDAVDGEADAKDESVIGQATLSKSAERQIARSASIQIVVDDHETALSKARSIVSEAGGTVEVTISGNVDQGFNHGDDSVHANLPTWGMTGYLKVSVPPNSVDRFLEKLADVGEVTSSKMSAEDVTERVVDTEARIEAQEASVKRIRQLNDRAESIADITAIERELTSRIAELEALKATRKSLAQRVESASVSIGFYRPDAEGSAATAGWWGDTVRLFGDTLKSAAEALRMAVAGVLWAVLVLGAPVFAVVVIWRRIRARRAGIKPTPVSEAAE